MADIAETEGVPITDKVTIIITDVEMPEMDDYVLTRKIKDDQRFNKVSVIMHSSLSAESNQAMGAGVGADAYVPKFEPKELASTLSGILNSN